MKWLMRISVCVFLAACSQETSLPHGYKYIYASASSAGITNWRGELVVDPHVVRYKVLGPYIVGERVDDNLNPSMSDKYGFFLLDMRSGELIEGLKDTEFAEALRKRGLDPRPF
jgi:hypothetical protein